MSYPLEPSPAALRLWMDQALDYVLAYVDGLEREGTGDLGAHADRVAAWVEEPLPETATPMSALLEHLFEEVVPTGLNTASPAHFSYVPNGGLIHAAVADFVTAAINRYVAYWAAAPGLVELETTVIRWLRDLVGLPATGGGVLLSGGSVATSMAVVTARDERLPGDFRDGTAYVSEHAHHAVRKAARLAGFPPGQVRTIPVDHDHRLHLPALEAAIEADAAAGFRPFFVAATAGTTITGAIDDLPAIADVCRSRKLWFHVDAAYGGFFRLTPRGRVATRGIERADSVLLNPHKSLFLPFGTGCLLVRDLDALERAHLVHSGIVRPAAEAGQEAGRRSFADLSPEMSRGARGLRVWLPLKLLGAGAFRDALDEKLDLARWMAVELSRRHHVELMAPVSLSTVVFRLRFGGPGASDDARNEAAHRWINQRGRAHLGRVDVRGRVALRACILNYRTHRRHVAACLEEIDAAWDHVGQ